MKKYFLLVLVISSLFLSSCQKNFPRQMAVKIIGETPAFDYAVVTVSVTDLGGNNYITYGVCYSSEIALPTINNCNQSKTTTLTGNYSIDVTDLAPNTTYHFRPYANYNAVTIYGPAVDIITLNASGGTVTDIDGNLYYAVIIGSQCWMAENLKTTKYRNGDAIPNVTDNTTWSALITGALCNYNNDANNMTTYGRLYNWYAVSDSRNIAPVGWHVPTDVELTTLTDYLGGLSIAGNKLKEPGTTHWASPNTGAVNETGFTALPGGYRVSSGSFSNLGNNGYWWSSTE